MKIKRYVVLLLICTLLMSTVPMVSMNLGLAIGEKLWGIHAYGETIDEVLGDLSPSGLGNPDIRPARYFRHDIRFKNVITNQYSPSSGYFEAGGVELKPKPGESYIANSGYLLIPLQESVIRNVVQKLNGNPDYVLSNSENFSIYSVDGTPYASFWDIVFYSGGGSAVKDGNHVGDGINSPLHLSTFLMSPKPEILNFTSSASTIKPSEIDNHKLSIESVAYTANYVGSNITRFYISGPNLDNVKLGISEPVPQQEGSYTYRVKKDFPLDFLKGLPLGTYTIRAETSDPFARTATPKTIQLTLIAEDETPTDPEPEPEPDPEPQPELKPPIANLITPTTVMVGDNADIRLSGTAFNDATIEHYIVEMPGSMISKMDSFSSPTFKGETFTWYSKAGDYTISGQVIDSNGLQSDIVYKSIRVTPPQVTPLFTVGGTLKENRKVSLIDNSFGPLRFPVDHNKTIWVIEPLSGGTEEDIKYEGTLVGGSKDILFKKAGQYLVTMTAFINVFGEEISSTTSKIITIEPDLPPVVDFDVLSQKTTNEKYVNTQL